MTNWKKYLIIGLLVAGCSFAWTTRAEAGLSIGIGLGYPGYGYSSYSPYGYGYGGYGYGGYGGYGYGSQYGGGYYSRPYYRPVVYVQPAFYWHHGRRVYYRRHHRHWR